MPSSNTPTGKITMSEPTNALLRVTRLRSGIAGAPTLMEGLDDSNKATGSLPVDAADLSTADVRHRLAPDHASYKKRTRVILHPTKQGRTPADDAATSYKEAAGASGRRRIRIILHPTRQGRGSTNDAAPSPEEAAGATGGRKIRLILHPTRRDKKVARRRQTASKEASAGPAAPMVPPEPIVKEECEESIGVPRTPSYPFDGFTEQWCFETASLPQRRGYSVCTAEDIEAAIRLMTMRYSETGK